MATPTTLDQWRAELQRLRRPLRLENTRLFWANELRVLRPLPRRPWWRQFDASAVRRMTAGERAAMNEQRPIDIDGNVIVGCPSRDGRRTIAALIYEKDRAWLHTRYSPHVTAVRWTMASHRRGLRVRSPLLRRNISGAISDGMDPWWNFDPPS